MRVVGQLEAVQLVEEVAHPAVGEADLRRVEVLHAPQQPDPARPQLLHRADRRRERLDRVGAVVVGVAVHVDEARRRVERLVRGEGVHHQRERLQPPGGARQVLATPRGTPARRRSRPRAGRPRWRRGTRGCAPPPACRAARAARSGAARRPTPAAACPRRAGTWPGTASAKSSRAPKAVERAGQDPRVVAHVGGGVAGLAQDVEERRAPARERAPARARRAGRGRASSRGTGNERRPVRIARRAATVGNASGRERVKRTLSRARASIEGVLTRLDP